MKERIAKLIDIKSIITLAVTAVFCYLAITAAVSAAEFMVVFTTIIGFYFGTQATKSKTQKTEEVNKHNGD